MEKIKGNYLTQPNRDFPLDCETLEYLQDLAGFGELAGNLAGDKVVIQGCEATQSGAYRGPGYVFLRTRLRPEGEILRWEGGPVGGGMYVREEAVGVTANNVEYPGAYTRRSLAPGVGAESYRWEDFGEGVTLRDLAAENASLRGELARLRPAPLGTVELWAGSGVPEGYALCDGRQLRGEDYPELHAAIGDAFNGAASASGAAYTTPAGFFRLPDLRGRFVAGLSDTDGDYQRAGSAGGLKRVALEEAELPRHSHTVRDYYYAQASSSMEKHGVRNYDTVSRNATGNNGIGASASDTDNDCMPYYEHASGEAGRGATHENRPPYYALAYIMRLK